MGRLTFWLGWWLLRGDRVRLERDYLALQSRALAAPGSALEELRRLRHELLSLKRDRALAEVGGWLGGRLGTHCVGWSSMRAVLLSADGPVVAPAFHLVALPACMPSKHTPAQPWPAPPHHLSSSYQLSSAGTTTTTLFPHRAVRRTCARSWSW